MPRYSNPVIITKDNFFEHFNNHCYRGRLSVSNLANKYIGGLIIHYLPENYDFISIVKCNVIEVDLSSCNIENITSISFSHNPLTKLVFNIAPRQLSVSHTLLTEIDGVFHDNYRILFVGTNLYGSDGTNTSRFMVSGRRLNNLRVKDKLMKFLSN